MYLYKNGDRCPCCGRVIEGKDSDWLQLFSMTVEWMGVAVLQDQLPTEPEKGGAHLAQTDPV